MFKEFAIGMFLQLQPNWFLIGDAQSRCSLEGCIAEVSVGEPSRELTENTTRKQTSLFYEEDEFYLHYELRKRIRDFIPTTENSRAKGQTKLPAT
jgi:hypothetical protein